MPALEARPRVFVGSSREGHGIARTIQKLLNETCDAEVWSQGTFELGTFPLEALLSASAVLDFAVLVLSADDMTIARDTPQPTVRDNVLFELGLFFGVLGRRRCFLVLDRRNPPAIPSDLAGITAAQFEMHAGNLEASLGPACTAIQLAIEKEGRRPTAARTPAESAVRATPFQGVAVDSGAHGLVASIYVRVIEKLLVTRGVPLRPDELVQMKADFEALTRLLG